MYKLYYYPNCGTCKKAIKFLDAKNIEYTLVHLVEHTPTLEDLMELFEIGKYPLKKFFNTSGKKYRELELKDKVGNFTEIEAFTLLASEGMLIKRPILYLQEADKKDMMIGFKEADWEEFFQ